MKMKSKEKTYGRIIVVLSVMLAICLAVLFGVVNRSRNTEAAQTTTQADSTVEAVATTNPSETEESTTREETTEEVITDETVTEKSEDGYTSVEQTVYASTDVNVRKGPSADAEKMGLLKKGKKITRIAIGDNGWSKVEYKGKTCYIKSDYLLSEKPGEEETTAANREVIDPTEGDWRLVVVNAFREYDKKYEPKLKKVLPDTSYNIYMDHRAADSFTKMYKAAKKDGITLIPISGYRSYERQETNHKNRIALWQSKGYSYDEAVAKTSEVILPPGTSEHNLGLAMDICSLDYDFDQTKEYKWLEKNAHKYGFILRYKEEWKDKTGIVGEPWHWRYVGKENAKKIKDSGLCLEEYMGISR